MLQVDPHHCLPTKPPSRHPRSVLHNGGGGGLREQCPSGEGSEPPRKKTKVAVSKRPRKTTPEGTSERVPHDKGKRPTKAVGSPDRAPTMRDLCEGRKLWQLQRSRPLAEVDWLKVALKKSEQCRKDLELVADSTYTKLKDLRDSRRRLKDEVLSLTKVTYELGYRVVLERFRAKYPESSVEEDPFAEWSEDANIRMEACQPFDDSTLPEE
ncbi:hypothetical protein B296_00024022 [Ensete ventricosum]|uniref:Uncharacterized protein n=1 Tax=Ensete ventricosum TaxID=4639 RepID=A0A426Z5S1_ENSVE|nr:hypothetical protein B296_00024022 [Ensete ventricosum]